MDGSVWIAVNLGLRNDLGGDPFEQTPYMNYLDFVM